MPEDGAAIDSPKMDTEQPEGSEFDEGQLEDGDNIDDEQDAEEEYNPLDGTDFRDVKALRGSYDEQRKRMTKQDQKIAKMETVMMEMYKGRHEAVTPEKAPEINEEEQSKFLDDLMEKGPAYIKDLTKGQVKELLETMMQNQTEFEGMSSSVLESARTELKNEGYGEMPEDVEEQYKEIMADPWIQGAFDQISSENFKEYGEDGMQQHFKWMFKMVMDAAYGRNAKKAIHNNRVQANRNAKKKYLRKGKAAGGIKPKARKSVARKPAASSLKNALREIKIRG